MYGSAKATKPKNIGVKHYTENDLFFMRIIERNIEVFEEITSIMDKLHNQKENELNTKEDLK